MNLVRRFTKQDGAPRRSEVVSRVEKETTEAAEIARIAGQHRLTDPRTNPAVRAHADRLRDDEHRTVLDSRYRRVQRQHRVEDRRAGHAERALEAIQEARETRSPAKSVLALHARRKFYMRVSLVTSVALAGGSAMGLEKIAGDYKNIPAGTGYIVEVGLTWLATMAIQARADLAQHGDTPEKGETKDKKDWRDVALWLLMTVPLGASMAANIHGGNFIGALCAAGAAAFGLFSYIVSDLFAAAAKKQAQKVTDNDEDELRDVASGQDLSPREGPETFHQTFFEAQGLPFVRVAFEPRKVLVATPELAPPAVPAHDHNDSAHLVGTPQSVTTGSSDHTGGHSAVPTCKPTPTREHKGSDHSKPEPTRGPSNVTTGEPTPVPTPTVPTAEPMGTSSVAPTPKPPPAKRRTRNEIRAELQVALKEHYDNGGGEPQVKPLAAKINANRRIVRELLDEMNVRPMIRKAAGQ